MSTNNNTSIPLAGLATYTGIPQVTTGTTNIVVSIRADKLSELTIQQSANGVHWDLHEKWTCDPAKSPTGFVCQAPVGLSFFRVLLQNLEVTAMTTLRLISTLNNVSNVRLDVLRDNTLISGEDTLGVKHTLLTDATGALQVVASLSPVDNQDVTVTNDVTVQGQNNNYEFFPTAANNTAAVYADGTQGVNVTGGWSYSNLATGKINWYLYGSTGLATDYKVSQLNSMYAVVNNQSTLGLALAQNPFIIIYTRPDSVPGGAAWYKSKLFFGSNAHTDVTGIKLLYTGADPVEVHPEITGINRIQLIFVEGLSTKPLAQAQTENILTGSLQTTNNTAQVGAFNFVMEEFGADWVKTPSILPIEFNKVMCDTTGSAVTVSSGTVVVSSQPHLSYLTDNVAVATMPAITGTVAVSSQPHLSYLTDNVAVATMPAITGTVAVSSAPFLSYLTSNIAVATQPALAFSTDKVDATGSAVTISSGSVSVSTLPSIPTGANVIGGVTTSRTTSSITSWENPTQIISFDSGNTVRQIKGSAGSLHSLSITNDNNNLAFVAIYDLPAAGVTAGATTPKAVFAINKNQQIQLPLHAVEFSNGISFFTATTYNGGTPLTLVYLTASYNG